MSKLTLIMPVYNGMPYIKDSIASLLNQSFNDYELIIVNDGSNDDTGNFLTSLQDKRIKVINKSHSGIIDSFNTALCMVGTKYTARVDSDDLYYPNKFEEQIEYLEQHPEVLALGTKANYINKTGKIFNIPIYLNSNHDDIVNDIFSLRRGMIHSSIVFRSTAIKSINGYDSGIYPEDYKSYLNLALIGKLHNLDKVLMSVRIHDSFTSKNLKFLINSLVNLLNEYHMKFNKEKITIRSSKFHYYKILFRRKAIESILNYNYLKGIFYFTISSTISLNSYIKHIRMFIGEKFKKKNLTLG